MCVDGACSIGAIVPAKVACRKSIEHMENMDLGAHSIGSLVGAKLTTKVVWEKHASCAYQEEHDVKMVGTSVGAIVTAEVCMLHAP